MISELHLVVGNRTCFVGTLNDQPTIDSLKEADRYQLEAMAKELGREDCVITEIDDLSTTLCCNGQVVAMYRRLQKSDTTQKH
jgi:hypothetical protein